jgi:hypothetical protein
MSTHQPILTVEIAFYSGNTTAFRSPKCRLTRIDFRGHRTPKGAKRSFCDKVSLLDRISQTASRFLGSAINFRFPEWRSTGRVLFNFVMRRHALQKRKCQWQITLEFSPELYGRFINDRYKTAKVKWVILGESCK